MKKTWFMLAFLLAAYTTNAQVEFISGGWNDALAKAKKENKYIFVDAFTDWCYWCKEMDRKTFPLKEVAAVMNPSFVPVKIDMEKDFGVKLSMKYRVSGFPTFLIFNPDGKLVYSMAGYQEADAFIAHLKTSLEPGRSKGYEGMTEKVELNFPDFYANSFKGYSDKVTRPESAEVMNYLDKQNDLYAEVNWSVMTRFIRMLPKYQQFILDNKEKYEKLYGKEDVSGKIEAIINAKFETAAKNKDDNLLQEVITMVDKYLDDPQGTTKSFYRINYYKETEQWIKLDKLVQESINTNGINESANEYAWAIYEKCDNVVVIKDAIGWMKMLCEKNPSYPSLDTYAALLYKNKQYTEAEQIANKAIATGKENNENVSETEALLEKIKTESAR